MSDALNDTISFANQMPIPAASQSVPLIDTTTWNANGPWASTATTPGPGKSRGQLDGLRWTGTVKTTGQAVTVTFKILTDPSATTNAAFETDTANGPGGGTVVVAAGNTYPFSWLPVTPDYRIEVLAGATPPTTLLTTIMGVQGRTSGV